MAVCLMSLSWRFQAVAPSRRAQRACALAGRDRVNGPIADSELPVVRGSSRSGAERRSDRCGASVALLWYHRPRRVALGAAMPRRSHTRRAAPPADAPAAGTARRSTVAWDRPRRDPAASAAPLAVGDVMTSLRSPGAYRFRTRGPREIVVQQRYLRWRVRAPCTARHLET